VTGLQSALLIGLYPTIPTCRQVAGRSALTFRIESETESTCTICVPVGTTTDHSAESVGSMTDHTSASAGYHEKSFSGNCSVQTDLSADSPLARVWTVNLNTFPRAHVHCKMEAAGSPIFSVPTGLTIQHHIQEDCYFHNALHGNYVDWTQCKCSPLLTLDATTHLTRLGKDRLITSTINIWLSPSVYDHNFIFDQK